MMSFWAGIGIGLAIGIVVGALAMLWFANKLAD